MLKIVRDGEPFKPGSVVPEPRPGDTEIGLTRLIGALDLVCKLLENQGTPAIHFPPGYQAGEVEAGALATHLSDIVSRVVAARGKIVVRYLGDLKPTEYGLDAQFFHLTESVTQDEVTKLLVEAASSGKAEADLINLQNVRDIKVKLSANEVVDLHGEIAVIRRAAEAIASWAAENTGFKVVDL